MLNPDRKIDALIIKMVKAYWAGHFDPDEKSDKAWVPHTELAKITVAYSQRFGEWAKESKGSIKVEKRSDGDNKFSYQLKTCPDWIDWKNLIVVITSRPIRHIPPKAGKQPKVEAQGRMAL